jgi:hypothetical protein
VAGPRPLRAGRSRRVKRSIRGSAQGSRPWPTAPPCDFALSKSLRKPLHVKHQCARASLRGNRSFTAAAQKNGSVTTRRNNAKRRSVESHVEEQDAEVGQTSRSAARVHAGLSHLPNRKPDLEVRRGSGDPPHQRRRDFHLYGWPGGPQRLLVIAARLHREDSNSR